MYIPVLSYQRAYLLVLLVLQATKLELNVNMAVSAEANRSDIHRLQTELSRLTKCNLTKSSFVTQMKERYLYLLKSNLKKKKWFERNIYTDERVCGIVDQDKLGEFIIDGLKPARYVFFFF